MTALRLFKFGVVVDPETGQVGSLVDYENVQGCLSLADESPGRVYWSPRREISVLGVTGEGEVGPRTLSGQHSTRRRGCEPASSDSPPSTSGV